MYLLEVGDEVTIQYHHCRVCDHEVGYEEYEMGEYEGDIIKLGAENLYSSYDALRHQRLACGGERFEYNDWMWTTCWVVNHISVLTNREPDWEV